MSEFKFACPVCGQHMMCDASHAGAVMECPTCFQKIVAPQAPAPDAKFILTGTKLSEKTINVRGVDGSTTVAPEKSFPLAIVIVLAVVVAAGAAGFFIYHAKNSSAAKTAPVKVAAATNTLPKPKPVAIAPPASDTNWTLTLGTNAIPDSPAAGRIHAQDFIYERATFRDGLLTLRAGTKGPVDFGCQINFGGAQPESLAGQTINVTTDADKAAQITLRWKDGAAAQKENYDVGYALHLEFGALVKDHLPGKIYLCTPDAEKSYLMGTFNADARKPKPKAPKK